MTKRRTYKTKSRFAHASTGELATLTILALGAGSALVAAALIHFL